MLEYVCYFFTFNVWVSKYVVESLTCIVTLCACANDDLSTCYNLSV